MVRSIQWYNIKSLLRKTHFRVFWWEGLKRLLDQQRSYSSWSDFIDGNPITIPCTKMKKVKMALKNWNKEVYRNIHTAFHTQEAKIEPCTIESDADPRNMIKLPRLVKCQRELATLRIRYLKFLKAKLKGVIDSQSFFTLWSESIGEEMQSEKYGTMMTCLTP